mmetsp:Transcript_2849/g.3009  ORF Transcript_2849/g.3009 Transcript_2849/m.3009 type:complete len:81 (+) Transcript_2849:212-454(+)
MRMNYEHRFDCMESDLLFISDRCPTGMQHNPPKHRERELAVASCSRVRIQLVPEEMLPTLASCVYALLDVHPGFAHAQLS